VLFSNVAMAEDREHRISSALSSLIDGLVPPFEGEDDISFNERQANALELATNILERWVTLSTLTPMVPHKAYIDLYID
jgi:hypothetical protein